MSLTIFKINKSSQYFNGWVYARRDLVYGFMCNFQENKIQFQTSKYNLIYIENTLSQIWKCPFGFLFYSPLSPTNQSPTSTYLLDHLIIGTLDQNTPYTEITV